MSQARRFRRVLVANRGEIAARVIRTCRQLGIETVLTVSDADALSLPARLADKTIRIGPPPAAASYLDVAAITGAARASGADAVHPGYGFLSENARLARACAATGVIFIGPDPRTLEATGDKLAAREHAVAAGLPVLPGVQVTPDTLRVIAPAWFPVLVKAAGGGGGRGLRVVRDEKELPHAVAVASSEADAAFGDPRVYAERYMPSVRHVEVQILGDGERVVHLGDRDCSVQRRYQKLVEEAPAPGLTQSLRSGLHEAAVTLGKHLGYRGAGTVEFIVDAGLREYYFLEVNARIQVEHPVTEAITGLDLVREQIAISEGRPLSVRQDDVTFTGHAIECRINAEDPNADFLPSPGTVTRAVFPADVRVDTHVQADVTVPPHYDSLLAKVIARGAGRGEAVATLRGALARCAIDGVKTNLDMQRRLLADPEFATGGVDTGFLGRWLARGEGTGDDREPAASVRDHHACP